MLELDQPVPPFTLTGTDRQPVTQDDLAGGIAVLAFFPLAFTGG